MPRARRRSRPPSTRSVPQSVERSKFQIKYHAGFSRSLKALPPGTEGPILAELQAFVRRWREGATDVDLFRSAWSYKPLKGKARPFKVMQISVDANRAALTILSEALEFWFLEFYAKGDQ